MKTRKPLDILLIKPSHYDDDGYVIRWWRSSIPANSLATVYGIVMDCAARNALGEAYDIRVKALDETNTRVRTKQLINDLRQNGGKAMLGLVGVQSNQFPRALDIAKPFREAGIPVVIGGFHVSGCLAMLPDLPDDLQEALDLGITLFAGELEGRLDALLEDLVSDRLQPVYDYLQELPDIAGAPPPFLPEGHVRLTMGKRSSFDAGRGCPYLCSFCTIINVQGRRSRYRTSEDVRRLVQANARQGVANFFISDDNFARNLNWEEIFDQLIQLRESGTSVSLVIQVDTQAHRIPRFIEKAARAGVTRAFIGMENINPDSLVSARKGQNRITDYRRMLQAWHNVGVLTYAGYILGFPQDTPETIRRDIEIIKRELPVDIIEFFILTPLPGSKDHQELVSARYSLDTDMNNFDLQHVTREHPKMSRAEWQAIYRQAWDLYYTPEHIATVLRRCRVWGYDPQNMLAKLFAFYAPIVFERMHPLEGGLIRRKSRGERRPGLPVENAVSFYPRLAWEYVSKYAGVYRMLRRYKRILKEVERDENPLAYSDAAMAPVTADETEHLELYTATASAKAFVDKLNAKTARREKRKETGTTPG